VFIDVRSQGLTADVPGHWMGLLLPDWGFAQQLAAGAQQPEKLWDLV